MNSTQELPLLGCLHQCTIISASADSITVDGPIFTADKINRNGWGIPLSESAHFAVSLTGQPLRYCPAGQPMEGIPAQHQCDAQDDAKSIAGSIDHVYPAGTDNKGRVVYHQRATITRADVIRGIRDGSIPMKWSVYGTAMNQDKAGMVYRAIGKASSLVDEPAYDEAIFKLAASVDPNLPLYKHQSIAPSKNNGGAPTMVEPNKDISQNPADAGKTTPAAATGATPAVVAQDPALAAEIEKLKADNKILADKLAAQPATSLTPEEVKKMIDSARAEERDQITRQNLANEVAAIKVSAGLLKPEEKAKEIEGLIPLSASALEKQKADYTEVAKRLGKTPERSLAAGFIPVPATPETTLSAQCMEFLQQKFHQTPEDIKKYATGNTRSVLTIGRKP